MIDDPKFVETKQDAARLKLFLQQNKQQLEKHLSKPRFADLINEVYIVLWRLENNEYEAKVLESAVIQEWKNYFIFFYVCEQKCNYTEEELLSRYLILDKKHFDLCFGFLSKKEISEIENEKNNYIYTELFDVYCRDKYKRFYNNCHQQDLPKGYFSEISFNYGQKNDHLSDNEVGIVLKKMRQSI